MRRHKVYYEESDDEPDLIQQLYEGGAEAGNDRLKNKYGDDVKNFSVTNKQGGIQDGLVKERGCTDMLCLLVFLTFVTSLGYLTYYGNANGNVAKLIAPIDGDGKICGLDSKFENHKYLYLTNFAPENIKNLFDSGVCVDKCPTASTDTISSCQNTAKVADCKSVKVRKTFTMVTYCFPDFTDTASWTPEVKKKWQTIWDGFLASSAGSYVNDLWLSSTAIWASIAMAPIYCFVFIAIMSLFAEQIAWICVVLVQLGLIAGAVGCYLYRDNVTEAFNNERALLTGKDDAYQLVSLTKNYDRTQNMLLGGMITFGILALLFLCSIFFGYKSLKLAIDVIDASADFLNKTRRIILVPILYFFVTLIIISLWLVALICVLSMNKVEADDSVIPQKKKVIWTSEMNYYLMWYMLFAVIWLVSHIEYTNRFVVQVGAASYYFDSSASHEGEASIGLAMKFAHINHLGSLAIGSFIIGVIRFIKIVFIYAAQMAAKADGGEESNGMSKAVFKCGMCYIECLEKVTDYINEAAFAYMAVSGQHFFKSAWNGFLLNIKHMLKFSFANMIANVFIFLGKVGITVGNVFSLLFIMKTITKDSEEVSSTLGPCIVVGCFTFFTASVFLGLFDTAVMAMMTSLAIDMDMHNENPKFGPPTFHASMDKIKKSDDERFKRVE